MTLRQLLDDMERRHPQALEVINYIYEIVNVWDDLVDRDKPVTTQNINDIFHTLLVKLPCNEFYQRYRAALTPIMDVAILSYEVSLVWEKNKDVHGLEIGHVLRYQIATTVGFIIMACYGRKVALEVLPEYYKQLCDDRVGTYLNEHLGKCDETDRATASTA